MDLFQVDTVTYTYKDGKKALDGVSMQVKKGESLTIIGANGSGKSTLLYILNGLLKPDSGEVKAFGRPITGFDEFRQRVSLLFQNPQAQLFSLNVWDELCFGPLQLGLADDEVERRSSDILRLLGIEHLRERGPWNLSGGEMKKVALGTCLSVNPDVILLDEPTTGLDPKSQVEFIDLIISLRKAGKTIVTSTHDLGIIQDISDETVVMGEDHRIMLEGKPWEVIRNTDALLQANLIYRRAHRHSWYEHEHVSPGMHEHEHIPEIVSPRDEPSFASVGNEVPGKQVTATDMEKLKILLAHWMEHNHEHVETYIAWAEKAAALGNSSLSGMLKEIAAETKKIDALFDRTRKDIKRE